MPSWCWFVFLFSNTLVSENRLHILVVVRLSFIIVLSNSEEFVSFKEPSLIFFFSPQNLARVLSNTNFMEGTLLPLLLSFAGDGLNFAFFGGKSDQRIFIPILDHTLATYERYKWQSIKTNNAYFTTGYFARTRTHQVPQKAGPNGEEWHWISVNAQKLFISFVTLDRWYPFGIHNVILVRSLRRRWFSCFDKVISFNSTKQRFHHFPGFNQVTRSTNICSGNRK